MAWERIENPGRNTLLSTFRQALEEHAHDAWARERLFEIRLADQRLRTHYVSSANLATLFQSTLATLLGGQATRVSARPRAPVRDIGTIQSTITRPTMGQALQSAGGKNRYLGIEPATGAVRSVGMDRGKWVEWRPFCSSR